MTNEAWDHQPGATPPVADDASAIPAPPTYDPPPYVPPTHQADPAQSTSTQPLAGGTVPPPRPPTAAPSVTAHAPRSRGTVAKVGAGVLAGALLVGAGFTVRDLTAPTPAPAAAAAPAAVPAANTPAQTPSGATPATVTQPIEQIAKVLSPAVVQIDTQDGLGSGVAYDQSGLIITNAHVVGNSSSVTVKFSDGNEAKGQVLGADAANDIAVVKVTPPDGFTVATLSSETPAVGETVGAVGSPFGLQGTVTAGIVSATDRSVDGEDGSQSSVKMIQTDAPINPGNSGGALANVKGEVIGINSSIYSQKGENNGIGFAIPIQTAKDIADQIASGQDPNTGQSNGSQSNGGSQRQSPFGQTNPGRGQSKVALGVAVKANADGTVSVASVAQGSPAEQAGLQQGDVIVSVDGQQVGSASDLQQIIASHKSGDTVTLEVERDGQSGTVDVQLATATTN